MPLSSVEIVDRTLGHACTIVCPFCAEGIQASVDHPRRGNWYHPNILGNPLGHACLASALRNAKAQEIDRLIDEEVKSRGNAS